MASAKLGQQPGAACFTSARSRGGTAAPRGGPPLPFAAQELRLISALVVLLGARSVPGAALRAVDRVGGVPAAGHRR